LIFGANSLKQARGSLVMIGRCGRNDSRGRRINLLDAFLAFFEDMVEIVENLLRRSEFEEVSKSLKLVLNPIFNFLKENQLLLNSQTTSQILC
jgi:hypothetical protein